MKKSKMIESSLTYNKFLDYIDKITPLTSDERDIFLRKIMIKEYKKGEIIIQEGLKAIISTLSIRVSLEILFTRITKQSILDQRE